MPPKRITNPMTDDAIKALIAQGVADALAEYEANRGSYNGDDSHDSRTGKRRRVLTTRECTYCNFLKCHPLISRALKESLTVGRDAAYEMPWKALNKMMNNKYCPRSEIKKLEIEIWNLKVKGTDVRTPTYYECENQWHYQSDCPELKNQNHGNQVGGTEARGMMYALGGGETDQDLDNMEDDINA
nr:putative zinc finger, CCHC-type, retrotransposon Gag domain protein [Tanacetum cinerariifolium]